MSESISSAKLLAAAKALLHERHPRVNWDRLPGNAQWEWTWLALKALRAAERER